MIKKKLSFLASMLVLVFGSLQVFAESKVVTAVDDSVITTKIKAKMLADKAVSSLDIKVETKNGIVYLTGNVKSEAEATAALEIAASTEGVADVEASKLQVQSSTQPLTDSFITSKVKGIFVREKAFGDKPIDVTGIHVETKDGIVYLTGTAGNQDQIDNAKRLAQSIKGVKDVDSKISLRNE